MMICGQLHSCEFKFGSVVNLWSVEQIASKKKIEIAKLVLGFFFLKGYAVPLLSYQIPRRYFFGW